MHPCDQKPSRRFVLATALAAAACLLPHAARAQLLQLDPVAASYTLGRFKYEPPKADGWRQIGVSQQSVQLVYAEKVAAEGGQEEKIDTRFAVVMEAHDIPAGTQIPTPSYLAELSRKQMSEARKDEVNGISPILMVPGTTALYTYRLLVKTPEGAQMPEAYEVYYVMGAPDDTQYLVVQAITKEKDYENKLYWTQFYGSLTSIKYDKDAAPTGAAPAAPAQPAAPAGAAPAAPAQPAAPAAPAAPSGDTPGHEGHGH